MVYELYGLEWRKKLVLLAILRYKNKYVEGYGINQKQISNV
jgi:hypothetical protein